MKRAIVVLALVVAGCGGTASPTVQAPATTTPTPVYAMTDEELTEQVIDNVQVVYGEKPRPSWWKYLHLVDKLPDIDAAGVSVFVVTLDGLSQKLAKTMCRDIATLHFDDDAQDLGFTHVHLYDTYGEEVFACKIPGY